MELFVYLSPFNVAVLYLAWNSYIAPEDTGLGDFWNPQRDLIVRPPIKKASLAHTASDDPNGVQTGGPVRHVELFRKKSKIEQVKHVIACVSHSSGTSPCELILTLFGTFCHHTDTISCTELHRVRSRGFSLRVSRKTHVPRIKRSNTVRHYTSLVRHTSGYDTIRPVTAATAVIPFPGWTYVLRGVQRCQCAFRAGRGLSSMVLAPRPVAHRWPTQFVERTFMFLFFQSGCLWTKMHQKSIPVNWSSADGRSLTKMERKRKYQDLALLVSIRCGEKCDKIPSSLKAGMHKAASQMAADWNWSLLRPLNSSWVEL